VISFISEFNVAYLGETILYPKPLKMRKDFEFRYDNGTRVDLEK